MTNVYGIYGSSGCGRSLMPVAREHLKRLGIQSDIYFLDDCLTEQTIINGKDTKSLTLEALQQQIETLSTERENQDTPKAERELAILEALYDYADMLAAF